MNPKTQTTANQTKPKWELVALSECGVRDENQDNYLLIDGSGRYAYLQNEEQAQGYLDNWPTHHVRLAVLDGMGGHNNGREISEALVDALIQLPFQNDILTLKAALFDIHHRLFKKYHQGPRTPGTTLVMADIDAMGHALIANIGDSRAFLWREKHWQQLSYDHTPNEFAWRDGDIDDDRYQKNCQISNHRIAQAVGYGSVGIIPNRHGKKLRQHIETLRMDVSKDESYHWSEAEKKHHDIYRYQLQAGDILFLSSDGLWSNQDNGYLPEPYQSQAPFDLTAYAIAQVRHALAMQSRDNLTCLLGRF